ncbi:MAG: hypothetical protein PHS41_12995, partial [Victivallaceae bacterium]|nr:hypothetical protein [Victivallaceae bacterium]
ALARKHHTNVNLIPYNATSDGQFSRPSPEVIARFAKILEKKEVAVSVRKERGTQSSAACGQLRAARKSVILLIAGVLVSAMLCSCAAFREAFQPLPNTKRDRSAVPVAAVAEPESVQSARPASAAKNPAVPGKEPASSPLDSGKPEAIKINMAGPDGVFLGRLDMTPGKRLELNERERDEVDSTTREFQMRRKQNEAWVFGK